ncbi:RNA polymerase sigma factor [Kiloniella sp.]|uniref:RNA polymerase sigma factor n=1 Tax=Kiloniella sp. TaxID=1938587 RepID=UPI003A91C40C
MNFEQKLETSMPKLKRYARYLTKDDDLASDLFQETYGRAHAKKHLYNDAYEMEQWLFPMMKNLWINQIKRRQKELQSQTEIENDSIQNNICFAKEIEHRSLLNRVQDVLKNLPQKDQEVLEQIVSFGHSYEEAARSLSVPIGTVMSRLSRARKRLKEKLQLGEEFIFMFIPPVFYDPEDTDTSLNALFTDSNSASDQDDTSKNAGSPPSVMTSRSKRLAWKSKSDLLALYYKKRQKNTRRDPYDYQLHASFIILGVEGLFETLPALQSEEDIALPGTASIVPQAEDRTVQLSEIRETHTARGNDHSLLEDTQHLNLLDEELDDPLASLIITGTTKETALSPEDTTSLSGQSYHQSIGTILELLSTQGVLDPTEILSTAAPIDGTETQSGGIDTSDETTTSVIPLSDLLGSGFSPVFTDPQTTTNTASDGFVVVTTSGGGSIMETVLGDDPTLLGGDPTLPII